MNVAPISEAEFLRQVIELAELLHWEVAHFRPAQTSKGWRTPVQGSLGKGWPDLVLAKPGRLLFAELKRDGRKPTPEQGRVLAMLAATGAEVWQWMPADFDAIAEILR